jgi:hypothetical protein
MFDPGKENVSKEQDKGSELEPGSYFDKQDFNG